MDVLEEMAAAIDADGELKLRNFGTFYVSRKPARPGRNPKTLEPAIIRPRRVLRFKPAPAMRAAVNGGGEEQAPAAPEAIAAE